MPEEILAWAQRSSDFGPLFHPHPLSGSQGHKENKKCRLAPSAGSFQKPKEGEEVDKVGPD